MPNVILQGYGTSPRIIPQGYTSSQITLVLLPGPTRLVASRSRCPLVLGAAPQLVQLSGQWHMILTLGGSRTRAFLEDSVAQWVMKQGDRLPELTATLMDGSGAAINLTGLTVIFHMRQVGATTLTVSGTCTLITPAAGAVSYPWAAGDTATAGDFQGEFEIQYSGQRVLTVPNGDSFPITIVPQLG